MDDTNLLKSNIVIFLSVLLLIVIFYHWLDQPLVLWVNEQPFLSNNVLKNLSLIADLITFLTVLIYLNFFRGLLLKKTQSNYSLLLIANSIAITEFLKNFFKFIFGRYWPNTWQCNNPSFLKNKAYGFHCFHSGIAYQSFPSGHAATVFAFSTIIWFLFPKYRSLCLLLCILVTLGLISMNYHFASDIIAGAYLGFLVSMCVYTQSKLREIGTFNVNS